MSAQEHPEPLLLLAAQAWARRGVPVFPLAGKLPRIPTAHPAGDPLANTCKDPYLCGRHGHGLYDATTNLELIREWWGRWPTAGIGLRTGILFDLLDLDGMTAVRAYFALVEKFGEPLHRYSAKSGRPEIGFHHYCIPGGNRTIPSGKRGLPDGVEVKGHGGYVVAPPSPHPSGSSYSVSWDGWDEEPKGTVPFDEWLQAIEEAATPPRFTSPDAGTQWGKSGHQWGKYGQAVLRRACEAVEQAGAGGRWNALALEAAPLVARAIAGGCLERQAAVRELETVCRFAGLREDECRRVDELVQRVLDQGVTDPIRPPPKEQARVHAPGVSPDGPPSAGPPAKDVQPTTAAPTLPDSFYAARPVLTHIQTAARARTLSPDALLGSVLARVSLLTNYRLILDTGPRVAVLNYMVALAGPSGIGKGAGMDSSEELLPSPKATDCPCICRDPEHVPDYRMAPPGSGEGMVKAFFEHVLVEVEGANGKMRKERVLKLDRRQLLIRVDEGEVLAQLAGRNAQTTTSILRAGWSGELLGFSYATAEKRLIIPKRDYRLVVVFGIQPKLAEPLFADAAGGTPQRICWFGLADPGALDIPPEWPGPIGEVTLESGGPWKNILEVDPAITAEMRANRLVVVRGLAAADELDSHRDLNRLKTAALLARLECRLDVSMADWDLAGQVMDNSDRVRDWVQGAVIADKMERREQVVEAHVQQAEAVGRVGMAAERIAKFVAAKDDPVRWGAISQNLGGHYHLKTKKAGLARALAAGTVVEVEVDGKPAYSPGPS